MPSPSERLQRIIDSQIPSEVVFKLVKSPTSSCVHFAAQKTKNQESKVVAEDKDLQDALMEKLEEHWNGEEGHYYINTNVDALWVTIKHHILLEYTDISKRCSATKRKTEHFIRDVKIDDKHLPNYLIQVFLRVQSKDYNRMTRLDRENLFEQFESLRRTYGKRDL